MDALTPHITDGPYGSLEQLALRALRRYGDFNPGSVDGEVLNMFLDFANEIIDELRSHPYWDSSIKLDYYMHQSEVRPIPDTILVAGLLFHYATQQMSEKAALYGPAYYKTMNSVLYQHRFGNTPIEIGVKDKAAPSHRLSQ